MIDMISRTAAAASCALLLLAASPCEAFSASQGKVPMSLSSGNDGAANDVNKSRRAFLSTATSSAAAAAATATSTLLLPPLPASANSKELPPTGAKAPDFDLPNSRGEGTTSLKALTSSGKWTVLYFYPGAFTQGCTLEARGFQRDIEKYRGLNTQIVGVSVDPPEKNAQFCSSEGLDFYMLSDEGGELSETYGSALSIPGFGTFSNRQTYIIDPDGNLRWVFTDVESRVARHSAEVLDKLVELGTAKA